MGAQGEVSRLRLAHGSVAGLPWVGMSFFRPVMTLADAKNIMRRRWGTSERGQWAPCPVPGPRERHDECRRKKKLRPVLKADPL
ncbi:hypothetical protein GCM10020221_08680 [Streptomyces thioluteus]|uniref:Uncharacterized protein n=1 Tax=Streptomyces thioluteus TaxID=66431 RepID=A0ABP6IZW9_STRTU